MLFRHRPARTRATAPWVPPWAPACLPLPRQAPMHTPIDRTRPDFRRWRRQPAGAVRLEGPAQFRPGCL